MISYDSGYSTVIDQFATYDALGYAWDLSFTGDASPNKDLYKMLHDGVSSSATGTISGQINLITQPDINVSH